MRDNFVRALGTALVLALLAGCSSSPEEDNAATTSMANVRLTKAQLSHIQLYTVTPAGYRERVEAPGTVDFDNNQATSVVSPFTGPVTQIFVAVGLRARRVRLGLRGLTRRNPVVRGEVPIGAGDPSSVCSRDGGLSISCDGGCEVRRCNRGERLALGYGLANRDENPRHGTGKWRHDRGRLIVVEVDRPGRFHTLAVSGRRDGIELNVTELRLSQANVRRRGRRGVVFVR